MSLLLAGVLLSGVLGCDATPPRTEPETRVAARADVPAPTQVVQRMQPTAVAPAPSSAVSGAAVPGAAVSNAGVSNTAVFNAGLSNAGRPRDKKAGAGPRITSKHIEDELNRLEAELE